MVMRGCVHILLWLVMVASTVNYVVRSFDNVGVIVVMSIILIVVGSIALSLALSIHPGLSYLTA